MLYMMTPQNSSVPHVITCCLARNDGVKNEEDWSQRELSSMVPLYCPQTCMQTSDLSSILF